MKEESPWEVKNKKMVYDNPWISVHHHEVINPAGKDGIYGTVHFKNLAIGVLPLDKDNNTWIVGQFRFPLNKITWEIPEGGGEIGTSPLETAKRELKEETGIQANKWEEILRVHTSNSVTDELGIIYIARDLLFFPPQPDEDEVLTIKKLPFTKVVEMVMNGEITDSLSVAAILKAKILLEENHIK